MNPDTITAADIDSRPTEFGRPVTELDLMTAEEWWDEFNANACCEYANLRCPCGGSAALPSDISRLLLEMLGEPDWESLAESRQRPRREVELW